MSHLETPTILAKVVVPDPNVAYTSMAFKQDASNIAPCPKCHATDHGIRVHRYFFRQPCRCCGARDHSTLSTKRDEHEKITTYITCPIVEFPQNEDLSQQILSNYIRYGINGNKFAEYYGYDIDSITEALEDFSTRGDGKYMIPHQLKAYKQKVIQLCEDERASWTFKRTLVGNDPSESFDL